MPDSNQPLPPRFIDNVTTAFDDGAQWLANLPALLAEAAGRWSLDLEAPFANLSYNYVAPATLPDGVAAILKAGVPTPESSNEIEALRLYDGRGAVRLLDADPARGLLLLERLHPGDVLTTALDDDTMTRVAARVMQQLWRPLPAHHPFPTVADWGRGFERLRARHHGGTGPFPARITAMAGELFRDLLASSAPPVLLHGDLHHENILSATRAPWLAIDPKGVVGEPAYEVGALLRNPAPGIFHEPELARIEARRLDILADTLGFDRQRMLGWGIAQAVLSGWWSYEDHGGDGWRPAIHLAETLASLR